MEATLIFPHQLFKDHPAISSNKKCFLIEGSLFFDDEEFPLKFHKQKLILHRASMKYYEEFLGEKGVKVDYVECSKYPHLKNVFKLLKKEGAKSIHVVDPTDYILEKRLRELSEENKIKLNFYQNPNFITPKEVYKNFFEGKNNYFFTDFYIFQRKRLHILIDKNEKPDGGKWSYDPDNRKKFPKKIEIPEVKKIKENKWVKEAKEYIEKYFPKNYGEIKLFNYPTTHEEAEDHLRQFLKERLNLFGPYEDALSTEHDIGFHSALTPTLNIGLINPEQIVSETLSYAKRNKIPMASLEGFIRQIIGWREYVRIMYELEGVQQRTNNFWKFKRKIPKSFWEGRTGIDPIDHLINKLLKTGYTHHIERLMVIGNFMLLCEFDPKDIYRWFMELFIDSYDWVMVPNVYAMSQFADGGKMMTKPYISGANYLRKMSDYPKGDWEEIWTGLYWRFISQHQDFFKQNPRLSMMVNLWNKMDKEKQHHHLQRAEQFLKTLT